jgi:hypothetical protein
MMAVRPKHVARISKYECFYNITVAFALYTDNLILITQRDECTSDNTSTIEGSRCMG